MDERPSLNNTLTLELLRKKLEQHALRGRSERLAYQELATLIQQLTDRKHAPEAPIPQDIQDVAHQKLLDLSAVKIKIVANDEPLSSPVTDDFQPLHSSAQWVFLNNCQQHPAFKNDRRVQALLAKWKPLHDVSSPYYLKMFDSLFDDYEQWIIQKSNNNLQALNSCPPTDDIISLKIAIKESITFYDHAQMLFPNHWSDFQTLQTKIAQELQKWHALQSLPLSSWRVHIAPYLHQDTIQFEIKERIRSHIPAAFAENMTDFVEEIYQGLSIQEKADLLHNTELASPSDRKSLNQTHDKIYQAIISQLLRQHPQLQDWEYIAQCAQSLYLAKEQSYFLMHAYKGFHALSENAPGEKILFLEKLDKHLSSAQDQIFKKEINSKRLNDIKNSIQNEANDKNISTQEWFSHIHKEPSHSKNEAAFYYARIGLSTYAALYLKENVTEEELLQALE
ncbi:MAG: hypothetical protein FJ161_04135, partial [Gammaproteobacteria bacterium]|nr:hypothetical protein [Gammaproteobacteria bacterium]